MMATLGEFLAGKSLFTEIQNVESFPFITGDAENLDLILSINFGQRKVFAPYATLEIDKVAQLIVKQLGETWHNYVKIEALKENVNERQEVSETITENEDRLSEREDVNKVASFNSAELVVNDGTTSNNTDTNTGEKVRTLTNENISPQKAYALLSNMARNGIIEEVIKDVSNALTLSIY